MKGVGYTHSCTIAFSGCIDAFQIIAHLLASSKVNNRREKDSCNEKEGNLSTLSRTHSCTTTLVDVSMVFSNPSVSAI